VFITENKVMPLTGLIMFTDTFEVNEHKMGLPEVEVPPRGCGANAPGVLQY
jgi:hypothetical protein